MSTPSRYEMIAHQMMKGCGKKLTISQFEVIDFCLRYDEIIKYLEKIIPRHISAGVCGALGKAILWYSMEEMRPFCERFAKRMYAGQNDPVHVLWQWLILNGRRNTKEIYCKTIKAIRVYISGGESLSNKSFRAAEKDIFEWEDNYKVMYSASKNQYNKDERKVPLAD